MDQTVGTGRKWRAKTADERRAGRRGQIMRAAIALYGETGYRSATVKAVCEAAGLTERYFYESFANSEDLLTACYRQVNASLLAKMREAAGSPSTPVLERIRAGLLVYLHELRAHRAAARLFLIELANVSPATEALASASLDAFGALLTEIVQAGPGRGPIPPLLLRGVVGGGLHIAQAWVAGGCREAVDDVAEAALRLYAVMLGT